MEGDHKHKIMYRTFVPKYGTVCQVLLQLVVAYFSLLKGFFMTVVQVDYVFTEKKMSLALQEVPLVIHDVFHEHCYLTLCINVSIMEVSVTCISLEN